MMMRQIIVLLVAMSCSCATTNVKKTEICNRYIMAPANHYDEAASDLIMQVWMDANWELLKGCDVIHPIKSSKEVFELLNITHANEIEDEYFDEAKVERIVAASRATHLVLIYHRVFADELTLKARIFELKPFHSRPDSELTRTVKVNLVKNNVFTKARKSELSLKLLQGIPNSFTFGLASSALDNKRVNDEEYIEEKVRQNNILPPLISGFGLTSVLHPYGFRMFDVSFRGFGSVLFGYFDSSYVLAQSKPQGQDEPEVPIEKFDYRIQLFFLVPTINGEGSVYTPLGTTFLNIGWGPGIFNYKDSFGDKKTGIVSVVHYALGQRAFMTDRLFFQLSADYLTLNQPLVENDIFISEGQTSGFFGLGYFFPAMRSYVRKGF